MKKFTLINEGGRLVKKPKQASCLGQRDLSKLDMWTQLTMRQKHDLSTLSLTLAEQELDQEQRRLLEQLNLILDHRLLPHIILEQNEQAVIKCEQDDDEDEDDDNGGVGGGIGGGTGSRHRDPADDLLTQGFADEGFLSLLQLQPKSASRSTGSHLVRSSEAMRSGGGEERVRSRLVLGGEWARPRLYLCICCGAKFDQRKSWRSTRPSATRTSTPPTTRWSAGSCWPGISCATCSYPSGRWDALRPPPTASGGRRWHSSRC